MSKVGLVLGGGGVSGAAYEMAALMAIEMATGWVPNTADVVIGTSAGAFVTATVRTETFSLDSLVRSGDSRTDVTERIRNHLFRRVRPGGVGRWVRHGLLPSLRRPGITLLLGSPAPFDSRGIADWLVESGTDATHWPEKPTLITAFDLASKRRVVFGSVDAPEVELRDAVAASSAVPLLFTPHMIDGRHYVDGGVVSGTHADLVLGNPEPLDFVLVIAPMAALEEREGSLFYEDMFDRVGRTALDQEVDEIRDTWPETDILVIRPSPQVLSVMRPNPMDAATAVPTFVKTLASLRNKLANPSVWALLERHLGGPANGSSSRGSSTTVSARG